MNDSCSYISKYEDNDPDYKAEDNISYNAYFLKMWVKLKKQLHDNCFICICKELNFTDYFLTTIFLCGINDTKMSYFRKI